VRAASRPLSYEDDTTPVWLDRIRRLADDSLLREAVAIASPSLSLALDAVADGRPPAKHKDIRRLMVSLESYRLRMSTRATPFGLFAGVAAGRFDPTGNAKLHTRHRTHTRPDMEWLTQLVTALEVEPAVLSSRRVVANGSWVLRGTRLELTDRAGPAPRDVDPTPPASVRCTPAVRAAMQATATPVPCADLVALLGARWPNAPLSRLMQLLAGLVRHGFLLTDLRPPTDCADPLGHVLDRLGDHPVAAQLRAVRHEMAEYDNLAPGRGLVVLQRLDARMRAIQPAANVLHVDLALDADVQIPHLVATELEQALDALWRVSVRQSGSPRLRAYHQEFLGRYGVGRAVPLTELLSEETGMGLPEPYRREGTGRPGRPPVLDVDRNRLLARLVAHAVAEKRREVCLDDDTVDRLTLVNRTDVAAPASMDVIARLMAPSVEAMAAGDFRLVFAPYPGHSPAGAVSGRFASVLADEGMRRLLECPDFDGEVPASLVYRPTSDRVVNVMSSPRWLTHRIPVGVGTFDPSVVDLPPGDLAVAATADRLVLMSRRLGREVRPTRFNVVNLRRFGTGMVRFLDDIGGEGLGEVRAWNWGGVRDAPFLPRVRYGRTVLASAVWRVDDGLLGAHTARPDWSQRLDAWREAAQVPVRVVVSEADQLMTLDLDEPVHRELFRRACRRGADRTVREVLDDHYADGWLRSPDGPHHCELVVPVVRRDATAPAGRVAAVTRVRDRDELHLPGGDWLYAKVYTSRDRLTELARDHLPALLHRADPPPSQWFFIRYADPDAHLRLRVRGTPAALWGDLLPRLRDWFATLRSAGLVSRLALDSYDPEVERYGGPSLIASAERVFHADSEAVTRILGILDGGPDLGGDPVLVGALSVLDLFAALGRDDEVTDWLARTGDKAAYRQAFTSRRAVALRLADPGADWAELRDLPGGRDLVDAWDRRRPAVAEYGDALRRTARAGGVAPVHAIARSLAHIHCNRLFGLERVVENHVLSVARNTMLARADRARFGRPVPVGGR
jgi:thiopeptide-type bacteriocin biosynthesis protein